MTTNLREIARDTLCILDAGSYRTPHGRTVDLRDRMRAASAGTRLYEPTQPLPTLPAFGTAPTGSGLTVSVTSESTLAASRQLVRDGEVAALVFASAKNPGGGFRSGARAQEED